MFFNNHKTEELGDMFNMARIGANIMKARKAKGLTQMALADELGISFQAVSNWERGQSCPDIAKLGELSRLFEVSIDELLGNERAARITRDLTEDRTPDLKPEELVQVAPLLTEEQADRAVEQQKMDVNQLAGFAPFVSWEFLNKIARSCLENGGRLKDLVAIAPFLGRDLLRELALNAYQQGDTLCEIAPIAPFLGRETTSLLAQKAYDATGILTDLEPLAPFLERELLSRLALDAWQQNGLSDLAPLVPFLTKDVRNHIAGEMLRAGKLTDIAPLLPFLDNSLIEEFLESKG